MEGSKADVGDRLAGVGAEDAWGGHAQVQHLLQLALAWVTARGGGCLAAPLLFVDGNPGHEQKGLPLTEPLLCSELNMTVPFRLLESSK